MKKIEITDGELWYLHEFQSMKMNRHSEETTTSEPDPIFGLMVSDIGDELELNGTHTTRLASMATIPVYHGPQLTGVRWIYELVGCTKLAKAGA